MKLTKAHRERMQEFQESLKRGLAHLVEAGKMLVELRKEIPDVYTRIHEANPLLNTAVLSRIELIGQRMLHPVATLYGGAALRGLMRLPYHEQERILEQKEKILVLVQGENGTHEVLSLAYHEMTDWQRRNHVREGRIIPPQEVQAKLASKPSVPGKPRPLKLYEFDRDGHITWNPDVKWTVELATATLEEIARLKKRRDVRRRSDDKRNTQ